VPHCIIEYAKEIEQSVSASDLVQMVHIGAVKSGLFEEEHIKTRAIAYEHFRTGSGDSAFVHVSLKILAGRNQQQRKSLTDHVLNELQAIPLSPLSLTVEVRDMERETYSKAVK
jgi:5-carboxymethyl-2-hydroxymuconate isomerase